MHRRWSIAASVVAVALTATWPTRPLAQVRFDVLIRGGLVVDGTGAAARRADVGVTGDRIRAVGDLSAATAATVIDASGRYVTPGFIDVHSHAGPGLASTALKQGRPVLAQGITTVLVNPDGGGPVDLAAQRAAYQRDGIGLNVGLMVPHGSVRSAVLGMTDRDPTPAEQAQMNALVRAGMRAGAFGLSSGLYYAPGSYSKTAEVIAMAREVAPFRGSYSSHIRDEADYGVGVVAAVDEVIEIAETERPHRRRHAHEGAWSHQLGAVEDARRAHRGGARARREGLRRPVSLRGQRHRHRRRADAALGPGGRARGDAAPRHRRTARQGARRGEGQPRAAGRRGHLPGVGVRPRYLHRRQAAVGPWRRRPAWRPRSTRSRCSRRATPDSCRSTCPRTTSRSSCASRGP